MRRAFVISFLINHKSSSAARRCSCNEKSSFHCRLVSKERLAQAGYYSILDRYESVRLCD